MRSTKWALYDINFMYEQYRLRNLKTSSVNQPIISYHGLTSKINSVIIVNETRLMTVFV